ncbi:MAG: hypothetical protein KKC01_05815 [Gammaproteobacteria bacterium]|nr:hypothetical protein [Gammaproteobacteria bacterium]
MIEDYENTIRDLALSRLSAIFNEPVAKLTRDLRFGIDLNPSFMSNIHDNELDIVDHDIHDIAEDVADPDIMKEIASGRLVIWTVGDYCELMIRCSKIDLQYVTQLLEKDSPKIRSFLRVIVETAIATVLLMFISAYLIYTQKDILEGMHHLIYKLALAFSMLVAAWMMAGQLLKDLFHNAMRNLKSRKG